MVIICLLALIIALIAAFAKPGFKLCETGETAAKEPATPQQFIATNGEKFPWTNIRLPDHVSPLVYRLYMHPNLTTFLFVGTVEVDVHVNKPTDFLIIHSKNLNISSHDLTVQGSNEEVKIAKHLEYLAFEQIYLKLGSSLKEGVRYTLKVQFTGMLSELLAGFYRSSYQTSNGETR